MTEAAPHRLTLGFERQGAATHLARRKFRWPFVLTRGFALDQTPAHMQTVIVQTSSGALHGADHLMTEISAGPGAAAHVTTQGAQVVQPDLSGCGTSEHLIARADQGAWLELIGEPRILFPGASLSLQSDLHVAPGGVILLAEGFAQHDPDGQAGQFARLRSQLQIFQPGRARPIAIERFDLKGFPPLPFTAQGSLVLAAPGPGALPEDLVERLTARLPPRSGLYLAASALPHHAGLALRILAADGAELRAAIQACWREIRLAVFGQLPADRRKGGF